MYSDNFFFFQKEEVVQSTAKPLPLDEAAKHRGEFRDRRNMRLADRMIGSKARPSGTDESLARCGKAPHNSSAILPLYVHRPDYLEQTLIFSIWIHQRICHESDVKISVGLATLG